MADITFAFEFNRSSAPRVHTLFENLSWNKYRNKRVGIDKLVHNQNITMSTTATSVDAGVEPEGRNWASSQLDDDEDEGIGEFDRVL